MWFCGILCRRNAKELRSKYVWLVQGIVRTVAVVEWGIKMVVGVGCGLSGEGKCGRI